MRICRLAKTVKNGRISHFLHVCLNVAGKHQVNQLVFNGEALMHLFMLRKRHFVAR